MKNKYLLQYYRPHKTWARNPETHSETILKPEMIQKTSNNHPEDMRNPTEGCLRGGGAKFFNLDSILSSRDPQNYEWLRRQVDNYEKIAHYI